MQTKFETNKAALQKKLQEAKQIFKDLFVKIE